MTTRNLINADRHNWTLCARENEMCTGPSERINNMIYTPNLNTRKNQPNQDYGDMKNAPRISLFQPGKIPCNNTTFGDPAPGVPKLCYVATGRGPLNSAYREQFDEENNYDDRYYDDRPMNRSPFRKDTYSYIASAVIIIFFLMWFGNETYKYYITHRA